MEKKETITIITPPVASTGIGLSLVKLTKYLVESGHDDGSGGGCGLGGEFGYGVNFENDVFMMHRFCWCDQPDCMWCFHDEDDEKMIEKVRKKFGTWSAVELRAPNFFYKPSGLAIKWYKWIGRSMEFSETVSAKEWKKIFKECINSIK